MRLRAPKLILLYWLPVLLWSVLIFWLSSIPRLESGLEPKTDFTLRKIAHFVEYGILAMLWLRTLTVTGLSRRRAFLFSILFCVVFAISDEIHQLYVPGRDGRISDVLIDVLGIMVGAGIFHFIKFNKQKNRPRPTG